MENRLDFDGKYSFRQLLVIPIFPEVITIAEYTLINTEVLPLFLPHILRGSICGFFGIVHDFWLFCIGSYMRIDMKHSPGISGYYEVPEGSFWRPLLF